MKKIYFLIAIMAVVMFTSSALSTDRFGSRPGSTAAPIALTDNGKSVRLADNRGRYVLLSFWQSSYRLVFTLPGTPGKQGHRLIFVDEDTDIAAEAGAMAPQCRAFTRSALGIFGKHNVDFPRYEPHDDPLGLDDVLRLIINELGTYSRMCTQTDRRI